MIALAGDRLQRLSDAGEPIAAPEEAPPEIVAKIEEAERPRWLWASAEHTYAPLLRAGVRVRRCHDFELVEALLLAHEGNYGAPRSVEAALARLDGAHVPPDQPIRQADPPGMGQATLFGDSVTPSSLPSLIRGYRAQRDRLAGKLRALSPGALAGAQAAGNLRALSPGEPADPQAAGRLRALSPGELAGAQAAGKLRPLSPGELAGAQAAGRLRALSPGEPADPRTAGKLRLLAAAESASALIAVEMGAEGLPWRVDIHDELLTELLGPRVAGGTPRRLATLAATIADLLDSPGLHPDSPAELRRALLRVGVDVPNTRSWTLKQVDHPVIQPLLEYKELNRIYTAHGWFWRDQWVSGGRFRPAYVPAGVVSGRWATRGGGALQIPKAVRGAARADDGFKLVVADAAQLEPRILAAVSGDDGLGRAAASGDLYSALAAEAFGGDRAKAKVALLGAMYGQTGGAAAPALAALRGSYPTAWAYVEAAARTGESGGLVRSWLGRTCPPSSLEGSWLDGGASGRARGRFTRNFVIQATAAEWAATLLALVREALWDHRARMVFFQHDEVIVHCPVSEVDDVVAALERSSQRTGELLFGATPVRFPLSIAVVDSYGQAK